MRDELPYMMNDDGTVAAFEWIYETKTGQRFSIIVPIPRGPDDGWGPGQYERFMQQLEQKSAPMIRSAVKSQFGTTKYRRVEERSICVPAGKTHQMHHNMMTRTETSHA